MNQKERRSSGMKEILNVENNIVNSAHKYE